MAKPFGCYGITINCHRMVAINCALNQLRSSIGIQKSPVLQTNKAYDCNVGRWSICVGVWPMNVRSRSIINSKVNTCIFNPIVIIWKLSPVNWLMVCFMTNSCVNLSMVNDSWHDHVMACPGHGLPMPQTGHRQWAGSRVSEFRFPLQPVGQGSRLSRHCDKANHESESEQPSPR